MSVFEPRPTKMPVREGGMCFEDVEDHDFDVPYFQLETNLDVPVEFYTSTPLPNEDIWKKFDFPVIPMSEWSASSPSVLEDFDELDTFVECADESATTFWSTMEPVPVCAGKDAREIRHHDCMWAGHCINKEHNRTLQQIRQARNTSSTANIKQSPCAKQEAATQVDTARVTPAACKNVRTVVGGGKTNVNCSTQSALLSTNSCAVKSNGRSLLLSSRTNVKNSGAAWQAPGDRCHRQCRESDGESPRPETPQSLSESDEEDDHPRFKHSLGTVLRSSVAHCDTSSLLKEEAIEAEDCEDYVNSSLGSSSDLDEDDDDSDEDVAASSLAVPVSEVTGQVCVPVYGNNSTCVIKTEKTEAYYSDHSYHLNKGSVKVDNLGVQTPSDSEEEIDVVSLGEKAAAVAAGAGSRCGGMGGTTLPTNPSAHDRQQLQLTVASAISKHNPLRITLAVRPVGPADSPPDKKRKCGPAPYRAAKRAKPQQHRRRGGGGGGGGSSEESEPDSCERRSMHNNMERQRRIDLRNLVEGLRVLVPELNIKKRAAKVAILREAAALCQRLREESKQKVAKVSELRGEQQMLRARVSQLRREAAAKR